MENGKVHSNQIYHFNFDKCKIRQVITLKSSSNSRIEGNDLIGMESNRSPEIGHRDISEA